MSELAFNLNGEPFELPPTATGWRVRKFKSKGAPEVVYGREGTPLVLPIDADMDDLRREARSEGRYRLDVLDEHSRAISGAPPAYVCIHPADAATAPAQPEPAQVRNLPLPGPDAALIEAMRINAEMARTVINQFSAVMESTALLLRAADAAGMPDRPPRPVELVAVAPHDEQGEEEEAEAQAPPAKQGGWMGVVEMLLDKLAPGIVNAVVAAKLRVPGGAVPDGRAATASAEPQARSTPVVEPAPGRGVPAPAASATAEPQARSAPVVEAAPGRGAPTPASSRAAHLAHAPSVAPGPISQGLAVSRKENADLPANLAAIDQADTAHFMNILHALSVREAMYAQALADELSPSDLRAWIGELKQLSVPEAVAKIRKVLGADADSTNAPPSTSAPDLPANLPTINQADMAHFMNILHALSMREAMHAQALVGELSPSDLRAWIGELKQLSVPEAVAKIRKVLGADADSTNAPTGNGASDGTKGGVP